MRIQLFDFSVELMQALLWQYNNATRLRYLLTEKNLFYIQNQTQFWQDWYTNVFNLETANQFGLAVWSIILGVPLFIEMTPDPEGKPVWGFNEIDGMFPDYESTWLNFDLSSFTTRSSVVTLTVEEQRLLLRLRYFQLTSRGEAPRTNKFLNTLFSGYTKTNPAYGIAYMLDGLDMTITYIFNFDLPQAFRYIFAYYDILPRPAGVKIKYIIVNNYIWGFNEVDGAFPHYINPYVNFENGNFIAEFLGD